MLAYSVPDCLSATREHGGRLGRSASHETEPEVNRTVGDCIIVRSDEAKPRMDLGLSPSVVLHILPKTEYSLFE